MRTARLGAAIGALSVSLLGLSGPAAAAAPTVTSLDHAFTTLELGDVFVYVDGYDHGAAGVGGVEVFAGAIECFRADDSPLAFVGNGTTSAAMTGATQLTCHDGSSGREATASVAVDLEWTATGRAVQNHFVSRQTRCVSARSTAPAAVIGRVHVFAPDLGLDVTLVPTPTRPAELAIQQDRCLEPGRPSP